MKIAVAGAGIAGLASAAMLADAGHEVLVFDQFAAPAPVGSGLMIQPVGLAVLRKLGLDGALIARAAPIDHVMGETEQGRRILDVRYADWRPGLVGHAVQRSVLFDLLLDAAQRAGARLLAGQTVLRAEQTPSGATLILEDGPTKPFDLVLDCLGSSSPLCPRPSAPLAYGALWALLDWPGEGDFNPARLEQRYRRASHMVGVLPVGTSSAGETQKLTFFWSLRATDLADWQARPLDLWKDEVRALWPATAAFLDQIRSHDDLIFAQYTHRTLRRPGRGRIVHLGDSFHATSPQLGQGANMALLDAAALADALEQVSSPDGAAAIYAAARRRHVAIYQSASWLFTPFYQSSNRTLPWLRDHIATPLSRIWPAPMLLARLVAGGLGHPVERSGGD